MGQRGRRKHNGSVMLNHAKISSVEGRHSTTWMALWMLLNHYRVELPIVLACFQTSDVSTAAIHQDKKFYYLNDFLIRVTPHPCVAE